MIPKNLVVKRASEGNILCKKMKFIPDIFITK